MQLHPVGGGPEVRLMISTFAIFRSDKPRVPLRSVAFHSRVLKGASVASLLVLASCAARAEETICGVGASAGQGKVVRVEGILQPGGEAGVKSLIHPRCPELILYFEASRDQERKLFDVTMDTFNRQKDGLGAYRVNVTLSGKVVSIESTEYYKMEDANLVSYSIEKYQP